MHSVTNNLQRIENNKHERRVSKARQCAGHMDGLSIKHQCKESLKKRHQQLNCSFQYNYSIESTQSLIHVASHIDFKNNTKADNLSLCGSEQFSIQRHNANIKRGWRHVTFKNRQLK